MYIFERSLWLVLDNDTERQKCKKRDHKSNRTKKRECSWQWKRKEEASFGLLRNLYAGQEETVKTGHGTTDGFQIQKAVLFGYTNIQRLYIVNLLI